jgi:hypothetical protein
LAYFENKAGKRNQTDAKTLFGKFVVGFAAFVAKRGAPKVPDLKGNGEFTQIIPILLCTTLN